MRRPPTLEANTVIGGDYRIVERIGEGGMGAVYLAEQLSTGSRRALKVLHPELVPDPKSVERFVEEARTSGRIPSEHVVQVLGAGVDRDPMVPWIAMELLEGEDLATTIARDGALPPEVVREMMRQLGHAAGAAHRMGIVHRDLKPENLFVARSQRVSESLTLKVLDFGIAKTVAQSQTAVTATSAIGSPLFMSPEQTSPGAQLRPATDVWAIGLIAFEALTGSSYWRSANITPFNLQALLTEVLVHPLVAASARAHELGLRVTLPQGFDEWFARCVAREPGARFAEAGACVDAYVQLTAGPFEASAPGLNTGAGSGVAATQAMGGLAPGGPPPGGSSSSSSHGGFAPAPGGLPSFPTNAPYRSAPLAAPSGGGAGRAVAGFAFGVLGVMLMSCTVGAVFMARSEDPEPVGSWPSDTPAPPSAPVPAMPSPAMPPPAMPSPAMPSPAMPSPTTPVGEPSAPTAPIAPSAPTGPTGRLMVNTSPWSEVSVDGVARGNTPVRIELSVGPHDVRMETEQGTVEEVRVLVREGETEPVIRRLPPPPRRVDLGGLESGSPPTPPSAGLPNTPSRSDIVAAMSALSPQVSSCAGGASGVAQVRVVFSSNGRVQDATVGGSSLDASVRACVVGVVRRGGHVPPFRQPTFSVNYPFRL